MNRPPYKRILPGAALFLALASMMSGGCAWNASTARKVASVATLGSSSVQVKRRSRNRLEKPLSWWTDATGYGRTNPDEETMVFLRTFSLEEDYRKDPAAVLAEIRDQVNIRPDLMRLHVLSELALIEGHQNRLAGNEKYAGQMLATAVAASFQYLFDPTLDNQRNAYDPDFRNACENYNRSLEGLLRIMSDQDSFLPGGKIVATTLDGRPLQISIDAGGRWRNEDFEKFEFVSDYSTKGLRNVHLSHGLGVPLIAIRNSSDTEFPADEKYYPDSLSIPLTAFLRVSFEQNEATREEKFAIDLLDPLKQSSVRVADRIAPLESDISTPLAYYLDDPLLDANWFATAALIDGDFAGRFGGLYMLEPYDPDKIPVIMVHGFWSSPVTWTEMFNDLRADKSIREHYQFWFYLYPTGQPFWFSARQMREDLAEVRNTVDPEQSSSALSEMVLVGHSMGGLVSRLQTIESHDDFWNLVSERSVTELKGDLETRNNIQETFFFSSNPSIARVITMGTPHRGSNVSNSLTRWASEKLISLPGHLANEYSQIIKENPEFFRSDLLKVTTSTDSLSTDSRFLEVMMDSETNSSVRFHNIVGVHRPGGVSAFFGGSKESSDGVVSVTSATCPNAVSEIQIESEHSRIHQNPHAIMEVRRILKAHLNQLSESSIENQTPQIR